MSQTFKIDVREVKEFENKLRKLHKSAYPNAVRNTLDSAAFDVKQNTMPKVAKHKFIERDQRFFKANSRVEKANGWDVSRMQSIVGFVSLKGTNKAVDDLEQQEYGGKIKGKSFIPMRTARTGKSDRRKVQSKNRISKINNLVSSKNARGKNAKERFVKSVVHAGPGGIVLSEKGIVWRVVSLNRSNGKWKFKLDPIYSWRKKRSVTVRATKFMEHSAKLTAKKIPLFFKKHSEYQFKKYL